MIAPAHRDQTLGDEGAVQPDQRRNVCDGARTNAQKAGLKIVYDSTFPANSTDVTAVVRAVQATNPDIAVICSYPVESAAFVHAINEVGFKPKMIGGGMVGLQLTAFKTQLGPLLNGIVDYEDWLPASTMQNDAINKVLAKYQAKAADAKVDPLGYYIPPWAYAYLQVLQAGVEATKSLDDAKIAAWLHANPVDTVVGKISFGADGEWTQSRILQFQFQNIKSNDLAEFKDMTKMPILTPSQPALAAASGALILASRGGELDLRTRTSIGLLASALPHVAGQI